MTTANLKNETFVRLDQSQISQHLVALGYKRGDTVYIRAFYPKDDPRCKEENSARKAQTKSSNELIRIATKYQEDGMGVYFVVNGGGQTDKEVTSGRAIFYEHDNLPKEVSAILWQELGLPEPTFQVDTGGKSIHSYWVFDKYCSPEQWKALQTDLLDYADADRSLKNSSRVMRLAGCFHISEAGANPTCIINKSGKKYSYEKLRNLIPQSQPQIQLEPEINYTPIIGDVPLSACLSKDDRVLIDGGAASGCRNSNGAKLARNLIGTAARLQYLGIQYSEHPRQLFDLYAARCSPSLDLKEADLIWQSAEKSNPTATLTDDAISNCVNAWKHNQNKSTGKSFGASQFNKKSSNNGGGNDGNTPVVELSLRDRLIEILSRGLSNSEEYVAFISLAESVKKPLRDIEKLARLIKSEIEVESSREENLKEVDELLGLADANLKLSDFLPPELANPLTQYCKWMAITPAVILTTLLVGVSSLHKVGTMLIVHSGQRFHVPPTLYGATVSETGQRKSPVFSTIVKEPLGELQNRENGIYQHNKVEYERELAAWSENKKNKDVDVGEEPSIPQLKVYYFTGATGEAIKSQAARVPDKSLMYLADELAGLFKSANQYRGGRGSDAQDILSYYDGSGNLELRKDGIDSYSPKTYLSIFGATQPSVLHSLMKDEKDPDGQWSRFIFVNQPLEGATLSDDLGGGVDISDLLTGVYSKVDNLDKYYYKLSPGAFKCYQKAYNKFEQLRVSSSDPAMRAVYSKSEGRIGRIAINLHVLEHVCAGTDVPSEIPLHIIERAVKLTNFYIGQIKLIHSENAIAKGELSAVLTKLLTESRRLGKLSIRDAIRSCLGGRTTKDKVLEYFKELETSGYGVIEKNKNSTVFIPTVSCVSATVSTTVSNKENPENVENDGFEEKNKSTVSSVSSVSTSKETKDESDNSSNNNDALDSVSSSSSNGANVAENAKKTDSNTPADTADTADTTEKKEAKTPAGTESVGASGSADSTADSTADTADTTGESSTIEPQTKVEITAKGKHKGMVGTVVEVPSSERSTHSKEYRVSFVDGTACKSAWFYEWGIKKYEAPTGSDSTAVASVPSFSQNSFDSRKYTDKECTIISGEHCGERGTTQAYCQEDDTFLVQIQGDEWVEIKFSELSFDTDKPQKSDSLAPGDKVEVLEPGNYRSGHTGQIVSFDPDDNNYVVVEFSNGSSSILKASSLKKTQTGM